MGSVGMLRFFGTTSRQGSGLATPPAAPASGTISESSADQPSSFLHTLGWLSAGAGALGIGLVIGRELRQRYKFNRRTPYDIYAHAGDYKNDLEFGVGI